MEIKNNEININMKYKIKPFLIDESNKYGVLFDEIMELSLNSINGIIEDMDNVFSGKYNASSFSGNLAIVDFDSKITHISHFDELIGEKNTLDIYNMLKKYRDKLVEYEKE
ncbi:MAG: hypothetical protein LBT56_02660 [Prevotellaceae bacterium]|jgi:hypothetical protein|nr:hypothetical protein [Prevotellaceae bacterium]